MADYSASVSTPLKNPERISRSLGVLAGKANVTNYNTTLLEITGITRYFVAGGQSGFTKGIIAVIPTGMSDNGHSFEWDYTTGAFKAYKPTTFSASTSGSATATEAASDDDTGEVGFIAIGFIR